VVRTLPAGEYRLAATTDLVPRDLQDVAALEALLPQGVPVTLGMGENETIDPRVAGREAPTNPVSAASNPFRRCPMVRWKQIVLVALWVASLVIAAQWGARAQGQEPAPKPEPPVTVTRMSGTVYSGDDIGFRVRRRGSGGQPQGALVVRIDGEWVEVIGDVRAFPLR
jgi:hypothetical protein